MRRMDSGLFPEQQAEGSEQRKNSQWCKNEDRGIGDMSMTNQGAGLSETHEQKESGPGREG